MAARRGKSQARRNARNSGGLPGWAWMVLGIVLTIVAVLAAPKLLKSDAGQGFFRPQPNPDAQPAAANADEDEVLAADTGARPAAAKTGTEAPKVTQYDFYTMLPADEVAMSDAELAATEREEAARQSRQASDAASPAPEPATADPDAATLATAPEPAPPPTRAASADTPYILQAGAFGASGDAEAVKARIALLGLTARVESAQVQGKTVYRVRMGPYGTASELAEAKRKLSGGGLPALAIKAR